MKLECHPVWGQSWISGRFCVSLTILYGGEVFSSLAVLLPPSHPTNLTELCNTNHQIMSHSTYTNRFDEYSKIAADFARSVASSLSPTGTRIPEHDCMMNVAIKVKETYCASSDQVTNPTSLRNPVICRHKRGSPSYDKPVIFIETEPRTLWLPRIYQRAPQMWWTFVETLSQFREMQSVVSHASR